MIDILFYCELWARIVCVRVCMYMVSGSFVTIKQHSSTHTHSIQSLAISNPVPFIHPLTFYLTSFRKSSLFSSQIACPSWDFPSLLLFPILLIHSECVLPSSSVISVHLRLHSFLSFNSYSSSLSNFRFMSRFLLFSGKI